MFQMRKHRRQQWQRNNEGAGDGAGGGAPANGAPAENGGGQAPGGDGKASESLLNQPPAGDDWLPEKFRVVGADGKLDEGASARKLAESYTALEKHKGAVGTVPATPAEYKLEAPKGADGKPLEGIDLEAFVADPMFKGIAERAHKAGVPNEHMQFFIGEYLQMAPELFGADKALTADQAKAELGKVWTTDADFAAGINGSIKAINAFGDAPEGLPGNAKRLMEKYGADPDFIAFSARIARELGEDKPANGAAAVTSDESIEALQKSEAYWKPEHPEHAKVKKQVADHFAKKFGTAARGRA